MFPAITRPPFEAPVMHWRRTFPGRPNQARAAREFVGTLLPDSPRLHEMLLTADELVVNALRHTKSGQNGSFTVTVSCVAGRVTVSVADEGGPTEPVTADAGELDEAGRGLRTVAMLAESWGWHGNDHGRTVTAVFPPEPSGM